MFPLYALVSFYYLSTIIPTPTTNTRFTRARGTNNILLTRTFLVSKMLRGALMKDEFLKCLVGWLTYY